MSHARPFPSLLLLRNASCFPTQCINCAACSGFAKESFTRANHNNYHVVYKQPETVDEINHARAALAACPVAAIRIETLAERRHGASTPEEKKAVQDSWSEEDEALVKKLSIRPTRHEEEDVDDGIEKGRPFPRPFLEDKTIGDVFWVGHHNEASFGAIPYLLKTRRGKTLSRTSEEGVGKEIWIMVDTPRHSTSAVEDIIQLTGPKGPDYLLLTHVDDTADHQKWADVFPGLKRIFHAGDLGRFNWIGDHALEDVEILLPKVEGDRTSLVAYSIDGEPLPADWLTSTSVEDYPVVVIHTPGHSPGSISLYKRRDYSNEKDTASPGILFSGDTYAYTTRNGGYMTGFPKYGHDLMQQAETVAKLMQLDWEVVAPGHGGARDYRYLFDMVERKALQEEDMKAAIEELRGSKSRTTKWSS